jgi:hypothetical protein
VYAELFLSELLAQTKAQTHGWSGIIFVNVIGVVGFVRGPAWFQVVS